jgi:hypothetical protein
MEQSIAWGEWIVTSAIVLVFLIAVAIVTWRADLAMDRKINWQAVVGVSRLVLFFGLLVFFFNAPLLAHSLARSGGPDPVPRHPCRNR